MEDEWRLNPLLNKLIPSKEASTKIFLYIQSVLRLPSQHNSLPSWQKMYITQPPAAEVMIEGRFKCPPSVKPYKLQPSASLLHLSGWSNDSFAHYDYCTVIRNDNGVTIGNVVERMQRVFHGLGDYGHRFSIFVR